MPSYEEIKELVVELTDSIFDNSLSVREVVYDTTPDERRILQSITESDINSILNNEEFQNLIKGLIRRMIDCSRRG